MRWQLGPPEGKKKGSFGGLLGVFQSLPVLQECSDRCCNATTCQLREGAECARGDCCQDCKVLLPAGRPAWQGRELVGVQSCPGLLQNVTVEARCVHGLLESLKDLPRAACPEPNVPNSLCVGKSHFPFNALTTQTVSISGRIGWEGEAASVSGILDPRSPGSVRLGAG